MIGRHANTTFIFYFSKKQFPWKKWFWNLLEQFCVRLSCGFLFFFLFKRYTYYRRTLITVINENRVTQYSKEIFFSALKNCIWFREKETNLSWKPDIYVNSSTSPRELWVSFISILIPFDFSLNSK